MAVLAYSYSYLLVRSTLYYIYLNYLNIPYTFPSPTLAVYALWDARTRSTVHKVGGRAAVAGFGGAGTPDSARAARCLDQPSAILPSCHLLPSFTGSSCVSPDAAWAAGAETTV